MLRKVSTLLLVAVFALTAISFSAVKGEKKKRVAGESVVMSHEVTVPNANLAKSTPSIVRVTAGPAEGIVIGNGDYDYGWNSGSPNHIAIFDNGTKVHMTYMTRDNSLTAPANRRGQVYVYWDAASPTALVTALPRPLATGASGFGDVDVIPAGAGAGIAVMTYHTPNFFAIDGGPGTGAFTESAMPTAVVGAGGLDPGISVTKDGNTIWYVESNNRTDFIVARSTDFGNTWGQQDSLIAHYTPAFGPGGYDWPVLTGKNGDLYLAATLTGTGSIAPLDNAHPDSADRIGYYKSTNNGTSWTWTTIGKDGDKLIVAPGDTVYVLFENFSGVDADLDASDKIHFVANGYTQKLINDSTASNRFYTLYWKEGLGWKIISDKDRGASPEYDSAYYVYSGNALGNAYPTIVADGASTVFAAWSEAHFVSGKLDTTTGIVNYDMWYAYSNDNGATWAPPAMVANSSGALFATAANELVFTGAGSTAKASAYLVYIADSTRGCFVFGEGTGSKIPWMFRTIEFPAVTGVGEETFSPNVFALEQNFPNPFNPTTSIRYNLGAASSVNLKVYNMLGQEVATVVNQFQNAGPHSVNFDASSLASGMYLYKIQAGSFSEVKKMMLLK